MATMQTKYSKCHYCYGNKRVPRHWTGNYTTENSHDLIACPTCKGSGEEPNPASGCWVKKNGKWVSKK